MTFVLFCVTRDNTILDYGLYSKELAGMEFDDNAVGLALRHDPCFGCSQYFIITFIPHRNPSAKNKSASTLPQLKSTNASEKTLTTEEDQNGREWPTVQFIHLSISYRTHIHLHGALAYHCFRELNESIRFRRSFIRFVRRVQRWRNVRDKVCTCQQLYDNCELSVTLPLLIEISLTPTIETVCLSWCYRVEGLVKKRYLLEDTMNWLSTLGGGYSSLGDDFHQFSEKACVISLTQFKIAMEMGDPIMTGKCRLFYALSQMQQGRLRLSKQMIWREYHQAKQMKICDHRLLDMCLGMWSKLQYFYKRKNSRRVPSSSLSRI